MARTVLEEAFSPDWIDNVFETHRQSQYARELLFSVKKRRSGIPLRNPLISDHPFCERV